MFDLLGPYIIVLLTALSGAVVWMYRHEKEKRQKLEARINEKKAEIYHNYIDSISRMFTNEENLIGKKNADKRKINDVVLKMFAFNRDALIYGSKDIIKLQSEYMNHMFIKRGEESLGDERFLHMFKTHLSYLTKIISAMRKELGHSNYDVDIHDIGKMFITDYDPEILESKEE